MTDCPKKNYAECTAYAVRKALASRGLTSRPKEFVGACKGTQRLNKIAFLAMIGAERYTPPVGSVAYESLVRLAELRESLAENDGDPVATARSLGMQPSRFRAQYNYLLTQESATTVRSDEYSSYPERKFYEKLDRPWSITAFDPRNGEVCVDIKTGPSTIHLSSTVKSRQT